MRFLTKAFVCAGAALAVAGCDPNDKTYFRQGVGVQLYDTDTVSSLELQETYLNRLCEQAAPACGSTATPATWNAFVRAGMNDIDERCDGYLTWLDNVRRSQAPLGKQITDTGTATNLIMQATSASVGSMAVVAAAFGLASNSFANLQSRLLLEVPHSTVQAVVLSRQKAYREDLFGANGKPGVVIPDRPAAIYALRSYLRLCMPITIEMEINNTVAAFERGGAAALTNSKTQFISAKSVGAALTPGQLVNQPPVRKPQPVNMAYAEIFENYTPAEFRPSYVARIQAALCVPTSEREKIGVFTRNLIAIYEQADAQSAKDGKLDSREIGRILAPQGPNVPCSDSGASNYYERTAYTDAAKVADMVKLLNKSPAGGTLAENASLAQARAKIKEVRKALSDKLTLQLPEPLAGQMTRDLNNALFSLK